MARMTKRSRRGSRKTHRKTHRKTSHKKGRKSRRIALRKMFYGGWQMQDASATMPMQQMNMEQAGMMMPDSGAVAMGPSMSGMPSNEMPAMMGGRKSRKGRRVPRRRLALRKMFYGGWQMQNASTAMPMQQMNMNSSQGMPSMPANQPSMAMPTMPPTMTTMNGTEMNQPGMMMPNGDAVSMGPSMSGMPSNEMPTMMGGRKSRKGRRVPRRLMYGGFQNSPQLPEVQAIPRVHHTSPFVTNTVRY